MEDSIIMTPEEAAAYLKVSRTRIYQLIAENQLRSTKDGKRRLVSRESVVAWAESLFASNVA